MSKARKPLAFIRIFKIKHNQQKTLKAITSKFYNPNFKYSVSSGLL